MTRTPIATGALEARAVVGGFGLGGLSRPLWITVGWLVLVGFVGALLLVTSPAYADRVRERANGSPALAFATGFPVLFGVFTAGAAPLFVSGAVDLTAVEPIAVGLFLVGAAATAILALVGTCFGLVAVGDRLGTRSDDRNAIRSLAVGAVVCAPTQLIPILGTIVVIGLASVGCGAMVRLRGERRRGPADGTGEARRPRTTDRDAVAPSATTDRKSPAQSTSIER